MQLIAAGVRALVLTVLAAGSSCPATDDTAAPALPAQAVAAGAACELDDDCASGFCDRQLCAEPEGVYGSRCTPAPLTPDGYRDGKLRSCGAYLCVDERCRSCVSDEECSAELGAPSCRAVEGRPGRRCGR